ncbi:hypothetical protein YC2023_041556 [Brassica napus]
MAVKLGNSLITGLVVGFVGGFVHFRSVFLYARGGNLWSFLPNDGIVGLSVYSRTAGVSLTRLVCGFGVDSRLGMLRFSDSEAVGAVLLGFEGALSLGLLW